MIVPPRVSILGVGVSAIDIPMALDRIERWIATREPNYVCVLPVHGVIEAQKDPGLRQIYERAALVTPDGMPLVWLSQLAGLAYVRRVYGPDLMLALCERSVVRGYRHFFYGGTAEANECLPPALLTRFPGLRICGSYSSSDTEEDELVVHRIRSADPDIVWVGLGVPRQEKWMAEHVGRVGRAVLIGVGAAFDFLSGTKRQAPRWMQRSGLEWVFRLASEPRRLGSRYLVGNSVFVWRMARQLLWSGIPIDGRHADTGR